MFRIKKRVSSFSNIIRVSPQVLGFRSWVLRTSWSKNSLSCKLSAVSMASVPIALVSVGD